MKEKEKPEELCLELRYCRNLCLYHVKNIRQNNSDLIVF